MEYINWIKLYLDIKPKFESDPKRYKVVKVFNFYHPADFDDPGFVEQEFTYDQVIKNALEQAMRLIPNLREIRDLKEAAADPLQRIFVLDYFYKLEEKLKDIYL